ncbi:MAG TPA: hypothetical protein VMR52_08265 [Dehalococcoidia bacterium]|nr:hypothetical protein [Dehalococcoidia bacterium]
MSHYNPRLPVKREPSPPPALWQQAAPAVIRATALVAAGVIGQWALRNAARKAMSVPFAKSTRKPQKAVAARATDEGVVAISETVVMRRVIVRR